MNERIDNLLDKAQLTAVQEMFEPELYRFAELIVRECVQICNDTNDASYLNGVVAGRKIKQYFGVEE